MQLTEVRVDDLVLDPKNARTHDKRNIETISNSLAQFGQVENIVVQAGTNKVIGGNGRVQAMRDAGIKTVQANVIQMNDAQAAKLALALNRTAELANWNKEQLRETTQWLAELDVDLADIGFNADELSLMDVGDINFPESPESETRLDEKKPVQCPNCGEQFSPS